MGHNYILPVDENAFTADQSGTAVQRAKTTYAITTYAITIYAITIWAIPTRR